MQNNLSPAQRHLLLSSLPRDIQLELRTKLRSINGFARGLLGIQLRPYQLQAANAIFKSVLDRDGNSFVIIFSRQSGKDELLADLILYILARFAERGCSIICAQPTYCPQTVNAMERLRTRAGQRSFFTNGGFKQTYGYLFRLLSASVAYFSAGPSANVVGATADRLLIINEAQDVQKNIYDQRFAPMAASGNATRVFSGTAWTCDTLLEREKQSALQMEKRDGIKRVFIITGEQVASHNKYYASFLKNEIKKLGRDHPLIRTQYFCENLEARSGMFSAAHRLLMFSDRPGLENPQSSINIPQPSFSNPQSPINNPHSSISNQQSTIPNGPVAFLINVAGQEESSLSSVLQIAGGVELESNPARDAVTLRIVQIDLSSLATLQAPTYRADKSRFFQVIYSE